MDIEGLYPIFDEFKFEKVTQYRRKNSILSSQYGFEFVRVMNDITDKRDTTVLTKKANGEYLFDEGFFPKDIQKTGTITKAYVKNLAAQCRIDISKIKEELVTRVVELAKVNPVIFMSALGIYLNGVYTNDSVTCVSSTFCSNVEIMNRDKQDEMKKKKVGLVSDLLSTKYALGIKCQKSTVYVGSTAEDKFSFKLSLIDASVFKKEIITGIVSLIDNKHEFLFVCMFFPIIDSQLYPYVRFTNIKHKSDGVSGLGIIEFRRSMFSNVFHYSDQSIQYPSEIDEYSKSIVYVPSVMSPGVKFELPIHTGRPRQFFTFVNVLPKSTNQPDAFFTPVTSDLSDFLKNSESKLAWIENHSNRQSKITAANESFIVIDYLKNDILPGDLLMFTTLKGPLESRKLLYKWKKSDDLVENQKLYAFKSEFYRGDVVTSDVDKKPSLKIEKHSRCLYRTLTSTTQYVYNVLTANTNKDYFDVTEFRKAVEQSKIASVFEDLSWINRLPYDICTQEELDESVNPVNTHNQQQSFVPYDVDTSVNFRCKNSSVTPKPKGTLNIIAVPI